LHGDVMAVIDRRLLPLIEALAESGADWLAFELFEGLHVGRPVEDSDEELSRARLAVRTFAKEERLPEEQNFGDHAAIPITGDEQIEWAAKYVIDRISECVRMLETSLEQLESIVSKGRQSDTVSVPPQEKGGLAIRVEGERISIRRTQLDEGIAGLSALRETLSHWSESVRTGSDAS